MKLIKLLTLFIVAAAVSTVYADEKAPVKEGFVIEDTKVFDSKKTYFKIGGYADSYFSKNYNNPVSDLNKGRIFDTKEGSFTLGMVQTKLEMGNENWEVVADLTFGPNAEYGNFGNIASNGNSITSTAIKQAYVGVQLGSKLKMTAGQFGTHVGYEVIEAYANSNYSLSNLFGYGPFYHQGVKFDYTVTDGISLMLGVANGWDSTKNNDNNKKQSVLAQIAFDGVIPDLSLYLNYVGGDETTGGGGLRHIGDLTASYTVNKAFSIGLNAAFGNESKAVIGKTTKGNWGGAALYLDYTLNPGSETEIKLTYRSEYFDDLKGARGFGPAKTYSNTLTATISMYGGHVMFKPEVRYDLSDVAIYSASKKGQVTTSIAFIGVY